MSRSNPAAPKVATTSPPDTMLNLAVILLALAASGGVVMLARRTGEKGIPLVLPLGHGLLALSGLLIVLLSVIQGSLRGLGTVALGCLVAAALAGCYVLARHLREGFFPMGPAVAHAFVGPLGLILLLIVLYF